MKKDNSALIWIAKNSKFVFLPIVVLSIISLLLAVFSVSFALLSKDLIDVATKHVNGELTDKIFIIVLFIIVQIVLQVLFSSLNIRISGKLEMNLKTKVFSSLLEKDWQALSAYHSGELINRLTSDISVITSAIINIIPSVVALGTRVIVSFCILMFLDPIFAILIVIICPIILILAPIYKNKLKNLHKLCQESDGQTRSYMQEILQNLLVIKSFNSEYFVAKNAKKFQLSNFKYKIKRNTISILANIGLFLTFTAGYYFALSYGAYKISLGLMTYGTLIGMLQLVGQFQTPFQGLSNILPQYYAATASAERIMELENLKSDEPISDFDIHHTYNKLKELSFNDISFSYDNETILENTSFSMSKGEFICIAGISGIGKSTLLRLALGFIKPQSGSISLNMNDSNSILVNSSTRKMFAYVPQGNMILSGTIRENIKFSNYGADDEDVIKAAKLAQISDFIETLPQKYDTMLGEKGLGLSEGQIQRIAIARALLSDAPILLLDEATSALDEKTESDLLTSLKSLKSKSCIIVSHKAAAINLCDKTIYIENKTVKTSL